MGIGDALALIVGSGVGVLEWIVENAVVFGWFVIGVGWLVSNKQANRREDRKEYRAAINSLEADIDRLLKAYRSYLTSVKAKDNEEARLQVHAEINRLRRHVESLHGYVGSGLSTRYAELYEVVTGGPFESKTVKAEDAANYYPDVVAASEFLVECADRWFQVEYLPKKRFWQKWFKKN